MDLDEDRWFTSFHQWKMMEERGSVEEERNLDRIALLYPKLSIDLRWSPGDFQVFREPNNNPLFGQPSTTHVQQLPHSLIVDIWFPSAIILIFCPNQQELTENFSSFEVKHSLVCGPPYFQSLTWLSNRMDNISYSCKNHVARNICPKTRCTLFKDALLLYLI